MTTARMLERECVKVLRSLVNRDKRFFPPSDCQECAIGQSQAWRKAKRLIGQLDRKPVDRNRRK